MKTSLNPLVYIRLPGWVSVLRLYSVRLSAGASPARHLVHTHTHTHTYTHTHTHTHTHTLKSHIIAAGEQVSQLHRALCQNLSVLKCELSASTQQRRWERNVPPPPPVLLLPPPPPSSSHA